jgi:EpsD family peptidyl-prolyl cis-trans isomerase
VLATYDGEEITQREVSAELAGFNFTDDKARKAGEQAALQAVLNRHILAKAARDRGIDKTPDYAILSQRAEQVVLSQQLEASVAKAVPPVAHEEAARYVTEHPDMFAEQKIFYVDQLRARGTLTKELADALAPKTSLEEAADVLTRSGVPFEKGADKLPASLLDPRTVAKILTLKSTDLFTMVAPNGGFLINHVSKVEVQPLQGASATNLATQLLTRQHTQEAVTRDLSGVIQKAKEKVSYAKGYGPPPARAATNAPAPATNAAAK